MLSITKFVAAIGSFLAMIALMPAELQKEIPQLFPEAQRGRIGIALALLAFVARYINARRSAVSTGSRPREYRGAELASKPRHIPTRHQNENPPR